MEAACNKEGAYSSPLPPRATSRQELVKVAVHLKAMAAASPSKTTHMYGVLHGVTPDEVGTDIVKWLVRLVEKCEHMNIQNENHTYIYMCTHVHLKAHVHLAELTTTDTKRVCNEIMMKSWE